MDIDTVRGLIDKANEARKRAQEIQDEHYKDNAWATTEAKANFDGAIDDALKMKADADSAVEQLEREQKAASVDGWLKQSAGLLPGMSASRKDHNAEPPLPRVQYKSATGEVKTYTPTGLGKRWTAQKEALYTDTMRRYLVGGTAALTPEDHELVEMKALAVGSDAAGGALVASEVMLGELVQALEDAVVMRRIGRVLPPLTQAASIKVATATDLDAASWTSEVLTGALDTATPFGARALSPHPLAKRAKISNTLIRLSSVDVEAWTRDDIANRFAAAEETAFMTGDGTQQPEGVFTSALPTTVTAADANDIDYDDLVNCEFALKAQYRPGASWIFNRTILKELHLIKDGNGRPLLRDIPGAGARFDILGYPVNESEYAPGTSTTGLDVGALGNWKRCYWIVDSLNFTIQRLVELYAETNQVGFIARKETDGMIVDGNGVVVLTMA